MKNPFHFVTAMLYRLSAVYFTISNHFDKLDKLFLQFSIH